MNRRGFLRSMGVATAALAVDGAAIAKTATGTSHGQPPVGVPPCGLYCGICVEHEKGRCHGCGCKCGKCESASHAETCHIYKCVTGKKLESCGKCADFPCTRLIRFTNDPIWRTHAACIENLKRRNKIGTQAWIHEQEAYWSSEGDRDEWRFLTQECERKWQEFEKKDT